MELVSKDHEGYYQCVPGTTITSTTMTSSVPNTAITSPSHVLTTTTKITSTQASLTSMLPTCTGTFNSVSASEFVANLHPGWNLGNTLDATPDEGSWNNAPVVASTFDLVKAAGFKSVRIPGKRPNMLLIKFVVYTDNW